MQLHTHVRCLAAAAALALGALAPQAHASQAVQNASETVVHELSGWRDGAAHAPQIDTVPDPLIASSPVFGATGLGLGLGDSLAPGERSAAPEPGVLSLAGAGLAAVAVLALRRGTRRAD